MLALAALTLSLHIGQTSFDVLDGVAIEVVVHNTGDRPADVAFEKPAEYEIDVVRNGKVLWSNEIQSPPGITFPQHHHDFMPGPSVLVVYVWNGVLNDGNAPLPGEYAVTAHLLGTHASPSASAPLHLDDPVPVDALPHLKRGDIVTIAGTLDATKQFLTDASGTVRLARKIPNAPNGVVAVRGYWTTLPGRYDAFYIQRWAPMP